MIFFAVALFAALFLNSSSIASEVPALNATINDFAGMMPEASIHDLEARLARFRTETSHPVVVVTVKSLDGESIENFGRKTFKNLPLASGDLEKAFLLVVARKERQVGFQAGPALRELFPEPDASGKLYDHVALYFDGLRPDLGIYGAVHYLFRVIKGDVRVGSQSEEEKLEETSLSGRGAGAIFAAFLGPVLALFGRRHGEARGGADVRARRLQRQSLVFHHGAEYPSRRVRQPDRILDVRRLERHPAGEGRRP
ncbi:MAG: TPM domain-containing protein [Deltaproteobacteria bacterium]|nr:TPM domain-containing protein [Deltaproteobacteria bacterium]